MVCPIAKKNITLWRLVSLTPCCSKCLYEIVSQCPRELMWWLLSWNESIPIVLSNCTAKNSPPKS